MSSMTIVAPPIPGELFSSWLYRQGAFPKADNLPLYDIEVIYQECSQKCDFDPDFDFESDFFHCVIAMMKVPPSDFSNFVPKSNWLIPRYYRGAFCYTCFCEHIRAVKLPTMLVEWCAITHTVCPIHATPLIDTPGKHNYKLNIALKVFSYYHLKMNAHTLSSSAFSPSLVKVLISMQSYMLEAELSEQDARGASRWGLIKLLIRIFLYPQHGIVNLLKPKQSPGSVSPLFRYNLHLGPLISPVACRRIAVLLTGLILDVADKDQALETKLYLQPLDQRHQFLDNITGLGRFANSFVPEHSRYLAAQLEAHSYVINTPSLKEFIFGFSSKN